jgi:transposase
MLTGVGTEPVYLAAGASDLRKGIDGFASMVQINFELDPFSPSLFVFCNKRRNRLKILRWSNNGFWLYMRRLEDGKFEWPKDSSQKTVKIRARELGWLLEGMDINQPKAHKELNLEAAV